MAKQKKQLKRIPVKRLASKEDLPDEGYEISSMQALSLSVSGIQCFVVKRSDGKDEYFTS